MIDDFENGEFERTLKEQADSFFLMPSERVWKSIYNDLHPGSKWPSLAVGVFLLLTLFWIGNTDKTIYSDEKSAPEQTLPPNVSEKGTALIIPFSKNAGGRKFNSIPEELDLSLDENAATAPQLIQGNLLPEIHNNDNQGNQPGKVVHMNYKGNSENLPSITHAVNNQVSGSNEPSLVKNSNHAELTAAQQVAVNHLAPEKKNQIHSIERIGRRVKMPKWEYFFSPMISSVHFGGTNLNKTNSSVIYTPVSKHDMDIARRLGFITGVNYYYPLQDKISFTTGAHLIYTGYNIYSQVTRPNIASLTFKDSKGEMFSKSYISYYANEKTRSSTNITNYNWQFSIPVGLQWDIFSGENIKISVVSTIEPFMVLGSNAYLLSGDASSYVKDPELIRKFNLSGNIGSVITFTSNNVNWKIGPNFRYQVLSTYNNIYPVKEHFVNYGIHVGVSKK